jgi:hypothetical protein
MQISKKSSYLSDKMHLEKVIGQNIIKTYIRAPEGCPIIVSKYLLWVHFVTKVSLTVLESVSKEDSFELFMT